MRQQQQQQQPQPQQQDPGYRKILNEKINVQLGVREVGIQ